MRALRPRLGRRGRLRSQARLGLALACVLALLAPQVAAAGEAGEAAASPGVIQLLEPIKDQLSGSSWLVAEGIDPRVWASAPERNPFLGFSDWSGTGMLPTGGSTTSAVALQQVPFRNPAPAFSRNQIITRQVGLFPIQTEPHIAVDPTDPDHLVMGTIDYNFPSISTYVSFDGGETWDGPNQVRFFREDFGGAGDPVVAFDQTGKVYVTAISIGIEEFLLGSLASQTEVSTIVVSSSDDGGLTWNDPVSAARSTVTTMSDIVDGKERGEIRSGFLDKPWMTVGPNPEDPSQDIIYVSYTEFITNFRVIYADELPFLSSPATETTIRLVRSTDGGRTWSEPLGISPTVLQAEGAREPGEGEGAGGNQLNDEGETIPGESDVTLPTPGAGAPATQQQQEEGLGIESNRTVQGSQPKVMADGTVVVAYLDTTNDGVQEGLFTIQVALSTDGGQAFAAPIQAGVLREPHFRTRSSFFRYWGTAFAQLAVGPNDEIYVATTGLPSDKPTDDGDIYLLRSLDRGQTWEEPVLLSAGDTTSRTQFFPSIAVSPDGVVHAMWGDMRDDPDEVRYHIYYTRSEDQGATFGFVLEEEGITFPDTRVTDFPSNSLRGFPNGLFIGDYFSIAATDDDVYMVWADTRLGEFGGAAQGIGFARQTAIASPSIFLSPPSGTAGRIVDIQGSNFQPDSNILILVGGVIFANERTNEEGVFTTSIFMPLTGEGATSISAFDDTGNGATASFFTEFGFDSLQRGQEEMAQDIADLQAQVGGAPAASPTATPRAAATPRTGSPPAQLIPFGTPSGSSGTSGPVVSSYGSLSTLGGIGGLALAGGLYGGLLVHRRRKR